VTQHAQPTSPAVKVIPLDYEQDVDGHVRVDDVTADLKSRSTRSGVLMIASHAIQLGIGIAGTAVLARLLVPGDFGLLAMVMTLISFVATIRDMGLPVAAVHKQDLTGDQASGLFWINAAMSVITAAIVAISAPLLAWFYGEPRLVGMTLVMSAGILISSLTMVHIGLMRRQMKFGAITALEIGAMIFGAAVGIVSALLGAGYWALVYQQVAIYVWQSASAWVMCRFRPGSRSPSDIARDPALRSMLRYGRDVTASRLLGKIGRNLDAVLIGYFTNATVMGLYRKAYDWSVTPFNQIYSPLLVVAVASFSRLQDDPARYRLYARTTLLGLFAITLPGMALLLVEADGFILLLLGRQWTDAIPIFRVLTVAAYFGSFTLVTKWLFLSEGRTAEQLIWSMISMPLMVIGVIAGIRWGAIGVAWGFAAASILLAAPGVWYCLRRSPFGVKDYFSAVWRPTFASIAAAALLWILRDHLPHSTFLFVRVTVNSLLYGLLYMICGLILPGSLTEIKQLLTQWRRK
jgi:PST family polysaccharide transporter